MAARRDVPIEKFVFGCHRLGFGPVPGGGLVDVAKHVVPLIKTAWDLGIRAFDSAVLYRATLQLGQALEFLEIDRDSVLFQTKCLRYLGLAMGSVEHQPDALLQGIPKRYHGLTDKWDCSPPGVEQQICRERIEYGGQNLYGVALHDPPDMEKQIGLDWASDIHPAVEYLRSARSAGFVQRIGIGIKEPAFRLALREGRTGCAGLCRNHVLPGDLRPMMQVVQTGEAQGFQVTLMGINYGQAFTLTEDPLTAPPFLFNYEFASPDERALMSRFYRICGSTPLLPLAAAVAGLLAVHFPNVVTQIVTSTMTPNRLVETVRLVREAHIPATVWSELKAQELIPRNFPTS